MATRFKILSRILTSARNLWTKQAPIVKEVNFTPGYLRKLYVEVQTEDLKAAASVVVYAGVLAIIYNAYSYRQIMELERRRELYRADTRRILAQLQA